MQGPHRHWVYRTTDEAIGAGFPLAGAMLPVIAALLLGLYSGNVILICSALVLGIGHIGIHLVQKMNISKL